MSEICIGSYDLTVTEEYIEKVKRMSFEYIDTGVSYNNLDLVKRFLVFGRKLISKISPFMEYVAEDLIRDWCSQLDNPIEIMMIHNARTSYLPTVNIIKKLRDEGLLNHIGVSNFSIKDIEAYYNEIGEYPEYNEFEINPDYIDLELIKYCKDHNIKIIAYCIFGGLYKAKRMIRDYSLQYLLRFASTFAEIIIVKSDNVLHMEDNIGLFRTMLNKKVQVTESKFQKAMIPEVYIEPKFSAVRKFYKKDLPVYDGKYSYESEYDTWTLLDRFDNYSRISFDDEITKETYDRFESIVLDDKDEYVKVLSGNYPRFEFFTEYKEYILHILHKNGFYGWMHGEFIENYHHIYNIYLLDNKGLKTKVVRPDSKLVILKVKR